MYCFVLIDVPSAPVGPVEFSEITKESVTLTWKPSTLDGGSEITGYVIEQRDVKRSSWTKSGTVDATTFKLTASRLIEDNEYIFRITAENAEGQSEPLESSPVKATAPKGLYITFMKTCYFLRKCITIVNHHIKRDMLYCLLEHEYYLCFNLSEKVFYCPYSP